jgi:hypothetical protein
MSPQSEIVDLVKTNVADPYAFAEHRGMLTPLKVFGEARGLRLACLR